MDGPLAGVRVIDATTTFMGPYATLLLAQMGADVIKVESPDGDVVRGVGEGRSPDMGPVFLNTNVGKRSVVLDLKSDEGRHALNKLCARADVFVHNVRPEAAGRLGIDETTMLGRHPHLVHGTFRGYGEGPYAGRAAYDDVIQAVSGMAAVQGGVDAPAYVATPMADKTVGLAGALAVVAALYRREQRGSGEAVTIPMFEFMASFLLLEQQGGHVFDPPTGPSGYSRTSSPYRRPYATKDGFLSVMVYTDRQWQRFFELAGQPEMWSDPRFHDIQARTRHIDDLYAFVEEVLATRTVNEWLTEFDTAGIPAMPVNTIDDLFSDPHLRATDFFGEVEHPSEGRIRQMTLPLRFSGGVGSVRPAPRHGEHTADVLAEHGIPTDTAPSNATEEGPR